MWASLFLWSVITALQHGKLLQNRRVLIPLSLLSVSMFIIPIIASENIYDNKILLIFPFACGLIYQIHFISKINKHWFIDTAKLIFVYCSLVNYGIMFLQVSFEAELIILWGCSLVLLATAVYLQVYSHQPSMLKGERAK